MLNDWFWRSPAMTLQIQRCVKTKTFTVLAVSVIILCICFQIYSTFHIQTWQWKIQHLQMVFPIQIPVKLGFSSSFITAGYISTYFNIYISCDWWFGTFLVFPYIGNIYIYNHPNWLSYFQRDRSITNQSSRTTSWCSARGRSACVYSHLSATASSTSTRNTTAAPAVATWTSSTPCLGVSQGRNDPVWASWYNRWFQTLKIC